MPVHRETVEIEQVLLGLTPYILIEPVADSLEDDDEGTSLRVNFKFGGGVDSDSLYTVLYMALIAAEQNGYKPDDWDDDEDGDPELAKTPVALATDDDDAVYEVDSADRD